VSTTSTVLIVVVIGAVIYMLFSKAERTLTSVNRSNKQTYTAGTAASSVITNVAPALGSFLGKLVESFTGDDDDGGYDRSGSSNYTDDSYAEATFDEGYV